MSANVNHISTAMVGDERGHVVIIDFANGERLEIVLALGKPMELAGDYGRRIAHMMERERAVIELGAALAEAEKYMAKWWPGWCHVLYEKAWNVIMPGRFK